MSFSPLTPNHHKLNKRTPSVITYSRYEPGLASTLTVLSTVSLQVVLQARMTAIADNDTRQMPRMYVRIVDEESCVGILTAASLLALYCRMVGNVILILLVILSEAVKRSSFGVGLMRLWATPDL